MQMKILVIGPAWVGDMVMSQSLYRLLKQQHPDALLHVMAPGWCLPLLERMPQVDRAIRMPLGHGEFQLLARWRLGRSGGHRQGADEAKRAGQGLALHENGKGGRCPGCRGDTLMLLALAQWLAQDVRFFNVFNYITLRAVLAAMTAPKPAPLTPRILHGEDGDILGQARKTKGKTVIELSGEGRAFADWLVDHMTELHRDWRSSDQ